MTSILISTMLSLTLMQARQAPPPAPRIEPLPPAAQEVLPRIFFNATFYGNWKPGTGAAVVCTGDVWTDRSMQAYVAGNRTDPWLLKLDEAKVRYNAGRAEHAKAVLILDIEALPLDARKHSPQEVQRSTRIIAQAVAWARDERPALRIGLYSMFPVKDYWTPVNRAAAETWQRTPEEMSPWQKAQIEPYGKHFAEWQRANDALGSGSGIEDDELQLADLFDITCPSLYQHYATEPVYGEVDRLPASIEANLAFIRDNIAESRRYGKPVYPFIWMMLHDGKRRMPIRQWFLTTREVVKLSDGVMLWDDYRRMVRDVDKAHFLLVEILTETRGEISAADMHARLKKAFPNVRELDELLTLEE